MHNYIMADISRIFKRVPRIILILVLLAAFCLASFIYVSVADVLTDPSFSELGINYVKVPDVVFNAIFDVAAYFIGLFGLFELIYVFSDDFKAKTTQIAIGVGISRTKVVFSKFIELLILLVTDIIAMLGMSMLMSLLLGEPFTSNQFLSLAKELTSGILIGNMAYSSLVLILLFATQSMTLGILSFLALHFHVVSGIIGLSSHVKVLQSLNLSNYTLTAMLDKAGDTFTGAAAQPLAFAGIAAYIGVSLLIAIVIFRKKELEF